MRNISLHVVADPEHLPSKDLRDYAIAKWSFLLAVGALVGFMIVNLLWSYFVGVFQHYKGLLH
jgi:hypothetical protein